MVQRYLDKLCMRLPQLQGMRADFTAAYHTCVSCFQGGGVLFAAGNGGSHADADHIAGELMKGFLRCRPLPANQKAALCRRFDDDGRYLAEKLQGGLATVVLGGNRALSTAIGNDSGADLIYAQPLYVMSRPGDVLLALSTSGNARNVVLACEVAKARQVRVIGLTGAHGGKLRELADVCIAAPANSTAEIQELHLPLYHCLCAALEATFFPE